MAFEVREDRIPFREQFVSVTIIVLNVLMFIYQISDPEFSMHIELAFVPAEFLAGEQVWTLFTSMFMHANITHIFFNMLFFYVVADNCEEATGHVYFLLTYLFSGIIASMLHVGFTLLAPASMNIPTLGASGAIAGIIAMYGLLFPNRKLQVLAGYMFIRVKAKYYILIFLLMQLFYGFLLWGGASTAYFAHLGGFLAGVVCTLIFMAFSDEFGLHRL